MLCADLVTRLSGGHPVVALRGDLDISGSADAVSAIAGLTARRQVVIVDLSSVDFMDCFSLRALLRTRTLARQKGSDVHLAAPQPVVRRLLELTGSDAVFTVHGSVDAAAASIGFRLGRQGSRWPAVATASLEVAAPLRSDPG